MKYLKTFNQLNERGEILHHRGSRPSYRNIKYRYVNDEQSKLMKEYAEEYLYKILEHGIIEDIDRFDFDSNEYDSYQIFENCILSSKRHDGSIWTEVYSMMKDEHDLHDTPSMHNSLDKILNILFIEYKIEDKLVDRLAKIVNTSKDIHVVMKEINEHIKDVEDSTDEFSECQKTFIKKFKEKMKDYYSATDLGLFYNESLVYDTDLYYDAYNKLGDCITQKYDKVLDFLHFMKIHKLDPLYMYDKFELDNTGEADYVGNLIGKIDEQWLMKYDVQKILIELNLNVYSILKKWEKNDFGKLHPKIKEEYKDLDDAGDLGLMYVR